jgi:hypothetical protein
VNPKASLSKSQRAPARGRVYRLTYSNSRLDDDPKLFQCRDAMAYSELNAALVTLGYEYATAVHLYPEDERRLNEFPAFKPADMIVLTTRPPLHDQVGIIPQHRKVIRAAKTELETVLFGVLAQHLEFCSRKHVELTKHAVGCLRVEQPAKWGHVEFYEYSGAEIQKFFIGPEPLKPPVDRHSSVAFFLRANQIPTIGCDFVASFGMDGYGTLIWNRIIRQRYPEWLASPRFVMAELIYKKPLPPKPISPEFVDDGEHVEVRLLT